MDLTRMAGRWRGTWRTWMAPDELYSESAIEATVTAMYGGKSAVARYTATLDGEVEGYALVGSTQQGAVIAWIDTWHTGGLVMDSHGPGLDDRVEVATTFLAEGEEWRWTTSHALDAAGSLVTRHHNEGPSVPRYLGVEAVMERVGD